MECWTWYIAKVVVRSKLAVPGDMPGFSSHHVAWFLNGCAVARNLLQWQAGCKLCRQTHHCQKNKCKSRVRLCIVSSEHSWGPCMLKQTCAGVERFMVRSGSACCDCSAYLWHHFASCSVGPVGVHHWIEHSLFWPCVLSIVNLLQPFVRCLA